MRGTGVTQTVADAVETARLASGVSKKALAETAHIPRPTLNRRLAGVTAFTVDELERISVALGVPFTSLLGDVAA